jgi:outer membrane protein assembly factor BamB
LLLHVLILPSLNQSTRDRAFAGSLAVVMMQRAAVVAGAVLALLAAPAVAGAQTAGVTPGPIPQGPGAEEITPFDGSAAPRDPFRLALVPRHPFMAPNGVSNLHNDAYQTDAYGWRGPLGRDVRTQSAFYTGTVLSRECASITFDSHGRLVTVCVGLDRPVLAIVDPKTLTPLATYPLPPRQPGGADPFTDFSGGGYFYLDDRDRVIAPTTTRHIFVIAQTPGPGLERRRDFDLTPVLASDDKIISALPDWDGRLWFASKKGVVGWVTRKDGRIHTRDLRSPIGNSFAVDERGGVYAVTDRAMYRLDAKMGKVRVIWRQGYPNDGTIKPGQTQAGSGTTPTVMHGGRYVAITDNADPVHVMVLQVRRDPDGRRVVCRKPIFSKGASATDQSLIGAGRALIAENNHGYRVTATQNGGVTTPGLQRVDLDRDGRGCETVWRSRARAPSVVPKVSARAGIVYTYTKPKREDDQDAWYLTALDFDTGKVLWRRLSGEGLGYNNNYAPVTIAPNGNAYVGVLGGMVKFRDAR